MCVCVCVHVCGLEVCVCVWINLCVEVTVWFLSVWCCFTRNNVKLAEVLTLQPLFLSEW